MKPSWNGLYSKADLLTDFKNSLIAVTQTFYITAAL